MAYTFLKAQGLPVGKSLVEDDKLDAARDLLRTTMERKAEFALPADHVVTTKPDAGAAAEVLAVKDPAIGERMGVDIGPKTREHYAERLREARTIVWNGPMGVFEVDRFSEGTTAVARAVASASALSVVGGGDSIAAVNKAGVADRITHISTGGGASLEFLGGRTLPGVAALTDK
jgi:phosphoglycerate kinase